MAKTLPAITITDAQYTRVARVIPGTTAAEKVAAYVDMVKAMLRQLVINADMDAANEAADKARAAALADAESNADNL